MLDRPSQPPDYPAGAVHFQPGQRLLCLAPHPDDEILGCGGLLALAARAGVHVHTVVVTDGAQGVAKTDAQGAQVRRDESCQAAERLGLPAPEFWHWQDRQVRYCPPVIERLAELLRQHRPDWLLLPALSEPHPDHQALGLAGMAAVGRLDLEGTVLFYEVGAPGTPNTLVDISTVAEAKWHALAAFVSQEQRHPYLRLAQAMASLRALGMGPRVQAAEAFWQMSAAALREHGAMPGLGHWPLQREAWGGATEPVQLPLVSVIIRSLDRPALAEAIASVAAQSYPNLEVVVVNATQRPHPMPEYPTDRLRLRVVAAEGPGLGRAQAANEGLQAAAGELALFLDDDDLLLPEHVQQLVQALDEHPDAAAAYGGVRVENANGEWIRDYDSPWSAARLAGLNFLPIHAVLFRLREARVSGCRFDETLPVLEDWDFWCQLAAAGDFVHRPGIGAVYRQGRGSSHLADPEHENHWALWHRRVLERHAERWGLPRMVKTLAWHAVALERAQEDAQEDALALVREREDHARTRQQLQQLQDSLFETRHELLTEQARGMTLLAERDLAQASLQLLRQSRPVRWARGVRTLLGREGEP